MAHIITGVIGAGVLSLAWSVAQLGWIAGPLITIFFAGTTIVSSNLLADCYRFPHPEYGNIRCPSYMESVKLYLGQSNKIIIIIFFEFCNFIFRINNICIVPVKLFFTLLPNYKSSCNNNYLKLY